MTSQQAPSPSEDTVETFLVAALEAFGLEPWGDVEPYVEKAWNGCRISGDPDWAEIRDRVRAAWAYPVRGE